MVNCKATDKYTEKPHTNSLLEVEFLREKEKLSKCLRRRKAPRTSTRKLILFLLPT